MRKTPEYEAVELPYQGQGFAMEVIVPAAGQPSPKFEQSLTADAA